MNTHNDLLNPPSTDFCMLDYRCAYLDHKMTRMRYRHVDQASRHFSSAVVERGWRRFGKYFFYPICQGCNACKSLRIVVKDFSPSRSQRRVIKKNQATRIIVRKPSLTRNHIELYNKYHAWKALKDDWRHREISQREYYENFVDGAHEYGKEVLYVHEGKLVGVDLIDITTDGISAIYFYHDPDYAHLSLGTYSLLYQIDLAKEHRRDYIYLGYWVNGCKAFAYKENFTPLEMLDGFPPLDEPADWQPYDHYDLSDK